MHPVRSLDVITKTSAGLNFKDNINIRRVSEK